MTPFSASAFARADDAGPVVGQPAPVLSIQNLGGGTNTLADLHGKGVIVTFFASWCPHCQAELTAIDQIWRKMCSCRGLVVMPVDAVDEDVATLQAFRTKFNLALPVFRDPSSVMTGNWGIQDVPTMFFVNRKGVLVARREGDIPAGDLNQLIETVLKYGD